MRLDKQAKQRQRDDYAMNPDEYNVKPEAANVPVRILLGLLVGTSVRSQINLSCQHCKRSTRYVLLFRFPNQEIVEHGIYL